MAGEPGEDHPGKAAPVARHTTLGAATLAARARKQAFTAPMGPQVDPAAPPFGIVLRRGLGANVWDVDDNRYVDLAAGFGALLLGHAHPDVQSAVNRQMGLLSQAMGDLYPSDIKLELAERLVALVPWDDAQVIFGQSGADALSSALKTALLVTGRRRVVGFTGAYHGLSFGPLHVCGLRESYRSPFAAALGLETELVQYPDIASEPGAAANPARVLEQLEAALRSNTVAAVVVEPILGRGGVRPLPAAWLAELHAACRRAGTLLIADEIWTGLGRAGHWLAGCPDWDPTRARAGAEYPADIVCLGKGLGGGVPVSACIAPKAWMQAWSRSAEVVDTSTFAGAPLACAAALTTLDVLAREQLVHRSLALGERVKQALELALADVPAPFGVSIRGQGLMLAVDCGARPGAAFGVMSRLLDQGVLVSTGGGKREVVVLTPPLTIDEGVIFECVPLIADAVRAVLDVRVGP